MSQIESETSNNELRLFVRWENRLIRNIGSLVGAFFVLVFGRAAAGHIELITTVEGGSWFGFVVCFAVVILAGYVTLSLWMNRTIVKVNDLIASVSLNPLPLPWFSKRVLRQDIEQVYVQEVRNGSDASSGWVMSYEVWMLSRDGSRTRFLDVGRATGQRWGDQTKVDANFIERSIE